MRKKLCRPCLVITAIASLVGCEPKLETGYVPRPLNSTPDERRAYYAPAFTPESHPAKEQSNTPTFGER